ncbi:VIP peptides-like [Pristis pectinata]|uniref:VIP peptides-like n=1 Tax=Pristis pectinata TaxID=685728 RepID=UPI00223E03BA|nr:VIP peptides-like [Pristis pectinata]
MVIRFDSQSVTLFALLSVLCSRGSAFPALGTYSNLRLGDAVGFDEQSKADRSHLPLKTDDDIYQSPLFDSEKLYRRSETFPRVTRHSDGLFTSEYSKVLGQMAARKYLESLMGKRVGAQAGQVPAKRYADAVFTDDYSRMQKQMALKNYIDNLLTNKRSHEELNPDNLSDTAPLGENYDSVVVDGLLNHLPTFNS